MSTSVVISMTMFTSVYMSLSMSVSMSVSTSVSISVSGSISMFMYWKLTSEEGMTKSSWTWARTRTRLRTLTLTPTWTWAQNGHGHSHRLCSCPYQCPYLCECPYPCSCVNSALPISTTICSRYFNIQWLFFIEKSMDMSCLLRSGHSVYFCPTALFLSTSILVSLSPCFS